MSQQTFTKKECQQWLADKTRNPRTNRLIKKDGPTYKKIQSLCETKKVTPAKSPTKNKEISRQLWSAARQGNLKQVKDLLQRGAEIDYQGLRGFTPLIAASHEGHLPVVKHLVEAGAEIDHLENQLGWTALMEASYGGHLQVVEALLAHRALVNLKNKRGEIALDLARKGGHDEIVTRLKKAHGRYTKFAGKK